jgi:hypothetical protein
MKAKKGKKIASKKPVKKTKTAPKTKTPAPKPKPAPAKIDPAAAAYTRWLAGEQLIALSSETGIKRSKLRRLFIKQAGGKPAYQQLRAKGAGGVAEPFGGKRSEGRTAGVPLINDAKVKRCTDTSKTAGWTAEHHYRPVVVNVEGVGNVPWREEVATTYVSPKGERYVQAKPSEKADLIVTSKYEGIPDFRMKLYETSAVARRVKHEEKLIKHGTKIIEHRRKVKRAKRLARKSAKSSTTRSL